MQLFGASWKTSLGGIVTFIGGLGAIIATTAFAATPIGQTIIVISSITALAGMSFGLINAKDKSVTGIGAKATTDPAKDATEPTIIQPVVNTGNTIAVKEL